MRAAATAFIGRLQNHSAFRHWMRRHVARDLLFQRDQQIVDGSRLLQVIGWFPVELLFAVRLKPFGAIGRLFGQERLQIYRRSMRRASWRA